MKIINIDDGKKIDYEVNGTRITFDDELMLNLAKYQNEDEVDIDICRDKQGNLSNSVVSNGAYVAQIEIPGYDYEVQESEAESEDEGAGQLREKKELDMDKVVLKLWNI